MNDFHRDFPRRAVRELQWCEDDEKKLRDAVEVKSASSVRLRIYNGGGVMHAFGGLNYFMEVIHTEDYCYTLLM